MTTSSGLSACNSRSSRARFWLNRATFLEILEERRWTQEALAQEIMFSRVHFNRLYRHRLPLSRKARQRLVDWVNRHGRCTEGDLWIRSHEPPQ